MLVTNNRSGRISLSFLFLALVVAAGLYYGIEYGSVYIRHWKFEDAVKQHVSFAGQLTDEAIRQKVLDDAVGMELPPQARNVRLVRTQSPRVLQVSIAYSDSLNLLFAKKEVSFTIDVRREF
jgi:hypothetical protein